MGMNGLGSAISKTNTAAGTPAPTRTAPAGLGKIRGVTVDKAGTASNPSSKLAVGALKVKK